MWQAVRDADVAVLHAINGFVGYSPRFDHVVVELVDFSFFKSAWLVAVLWWAWFRFDSGRRADLLQSLFGLFAAVFIARALQTFLPLNERPIHVAAFGLKLAAGINSDTLRSWHSFPSDHAVLFFGLTAIMWRIKPAIGVVSFLWALTIVCLPRVYLGFHYPTDILGGAMIGVALVYISPFVTGKLAHRVLDFERTSPQVFYPTAFLLIFEMGMLFSNVRRIGSETLHLLHQVVASI